MISTKPAWHVLIVSLPTRSATERMRVWRALKAMGCGVLRDGVYLLPAVEQARGVFAHQAAEVNAAGGQAYVLSLDSEDSVQEQMFRALFDRDAEYGALKKEIAGLQAKLKRPPATLAREAAQLQKTFSALAETDYFPSAAQAQIQALLDELLQQITAKLNPGEPQAASGKIKAALARKLAHLCAAWSAIHGTP